MRYKTLVAHGLGSKLNVAAIYALVIAAMILIATILVVAIAYSIAMHRITRKLQDTVEEMEGILATKLEAARYELERSYGNGGSSVPPMRIHWESALDKPMVFGRIGTKVIEWLDANDYRFVGQFIVEEVGGEIIRAYCRRDQRLAALMRLPTDGSEAYMEFCFNLGDNEIAGVANPPSSTVPLPPDAIGAYYPEVLSEDFLVLDRMHLEASSLASTHSTEPMPKEPDGLAKLFEDTHATEMDFRLGTGGISEQEIRSAFRRQGDSASEDDIDTIQREWQEAIEKHLLDFSSRGLNYHHSGKKVLIVHDGIVRSYLTDRIRLALEELSVDQEHQIELLDTYDEFHQLLARFSPREAVARFRPLLPQAFRYDLVDQLSQPVEADLYVLP